MVNKAIFLLLITIGMNAGAQQPVKVVKWQAVERLLSQRSDTTFVVHFWATWCGPCMKELPVFFDISQRFKNKKIKLLLISTDFVRDIRKLETFVSKNKIKEEVWLINETDYNSWIEKIDQKWSGAIPATLILNNKKQKRMFWEQTLDLNGLNSGLVGF